MSVDEKQKRRVVVIGGGVSGLAAAHRLVETGDDARLEVLLLEASPRPGGVVRTYQRDGFLLEGGPDAFISEKPAALELARRLGLGPRVVGTNEAFRRSFVARGARLYPTPPGFQLLAPSRLGPLVTSRIFSLKGKARMALDLVLPRRTPSGDADDESLADFVRRRLGREALERIAQPMAGGVHTADPELLSLRATFPRFVEMEREHRSVILALWRASRRERANGASRAASGARYSLFLSFDRGMQTLTDALALRLPATSLRLNTRADSLSYDPTTRRWRVTTHTGETHDADALVVALPAHAAAPLLRATDPALAEELDAIPYASTATVNLAYRRDAIAHPLDGFGFVVPHAERRATIACSFSSVKFEGRAPEGCVLLRAFVGGALQPETFALDDERMVAAVRLDLRELLGERAAPLFTHVERWPRSMAQYHVGHLSRVARIRERLRDFPTLRLAGNAFDGAGLPDCVRGGETAADELARDSLTDSQK